jgi:hypothetical protein
MQPLFDKTGQVVAWVPWAAQPMLDLYGKCTGWLYSDGLYDVRGRQIGWWKGDHFVDRNGAMIAFLAGAKIPGTQLPPIRPKPPEPIPRPLPTKPTFYPTPPRPASKPAWSKSDFGALQGDKERRTLARLRQWLQR